MNNRIKKVDSLIKEELSKILLKEVDFQDGILVTITRCETSKNLSDAKVYISVIKEQEIDKVLDILNRRIYDIQQSLNRRLKMKPIPKIEFKKETKTQQAARVEELLEQINHPD